MVAKNQLPKFVRIQTIYLGAHSNATHTLFHSNQYELVAKVEQTKLNIPAELLASWKAGIDMEVEINKQSAASALTKELEAKDTDRDRVLSQLFGLMKVHRLSFVEAERKAAERLYAALKPYIGIQKEIYGDETIHIVGLLKDTERLAAEVTALGLAPLLAHLKALNDEYRTLDAQRRSDTVASKLPNARSIRRQTDADFEVICQCIQASYMLAANNADKELILTLVDEMNRISSDLKASHNASAAHKKGDKPGKDRPNNKKEKLQKEFDEKVAPLIAAFEQQEGLAAGSLKFAGKATGRGAERKYELAVAGSEKTIWVQVKGDHLVQVVSVKPKE